MSEAVIIRRLSPADAAAVQAIRRVALAAHPDAYHSTLEEGAGDIQDFERRLVRNRYWGALSGVNLVGLVQLAVEARDRTKMRHKSELWNVYVAPGHRGDGTARRLIEAAIADARALGYEALCLSVAAANTGVVRFYETLGFERYGLEKRAVKFPDGRYGDDLLMQLDL